MSWAVDLHEDLVAELAELEPLVRRELLAQADVLRIVGPTLGRPRADTLSGSRHANMKELRFRADGGVWRAAFAFDPRRTAIILVAADKQGVAQRRFYASLIANADARYDAHLATLPLENG